MFQYTDFDHRFVRERAEQFRGQVSRRLSGELSEEQFKPLRLMNGVYLQLHAYMLRVNIPYGQLSSAQMRKLAHIARTYDRGYGHFTTRQNVQFNWPKLKDIPDILNELADVEMHAIQSSGNCIRNVTADHFSGVAADEVTDPRIYAEIVRRWSTLHPEFTYLPRKFKIALSGSDADRAAVYFHDIGLILQNNDDGETGFKVLVGGGQGRTPMKGRVVKDFLRWPDLLSYLEAVLRVYNLIGRRDNKYKARIKILLHETGLEELKALIDREWCFTKKTVGPVTERDIADIQSRLVLPEYGPVDEGGVAKTETAKAENPDFAHWLKSNTHDHKRDGYRIVTLSLKPTGGIPGDLTADQMDQVADLADRFSLGEMAVSHEQNIVFPHVKQSALFELWTDLQNIDLATANIGRIGDIISCPGMDYCALATTRSIPVARRISENFAELDRQHDIGEIRVKISGCINACGHHHVGDIGLLGVDRRGEEYYQLSLGGKIGSDSAIGTIIGPAFSTDEVVDAVEAVIETYLELRQTDETFSDAVERLGLAPFKARLYPENFHDAA